MPVEGVIGGSVCTHLGTKARPSPQTDTERFASIVIYCPLGVQVRHLATNTHPANARRKNVNVSECTALKLIKMYNLLASKQPRTGQCTFSGPVPHIGRAQRRSCERFAKYARYRQTE